MANSVEVIEMIKSLADAGLDFTPQADRIEKMAGLWAGIFSDIPGEILTIAARDYLMTETTWPAPAKLRKLAETVKAHNGTSAAPNRFKDDNAAAGCLPDFIARAGADRWHSIRPNETPRPPEAITLEVVRRVAKIGDAVMTEAQHAKAAALIEAWLEANA